MDSKHALRIEQDDADTVRFIERVFPLPSIVLMALVVYGSTRPWWTGGLALLLMGFNLGLSQALDRGVLPWRRELHYVRYAGTSALLFAFGAISGPDCPTYLAAVPPIAGASFLLTTWHAWVAMMLCVLGVTAGSLVAGASWLALMPGMAVELCFGGILVSMVHYLRQRGRELARTTEELQLASRIKDQFLSVMSHEVRTPLHGMLGAVSLLEDGDIADEQRDNLQIVASCGHDLVQLLTQILDFSKLQAGALQLADEPFEPARLGADMLERMGATVKARGLALDHRVAADTPRRCRGDAERIGHVLFHLLDNAAKFTPAGRVSLAIGATLTGLRFEVADTGIGIDERDRAGLFDAFSLVDASTTRRHRGSGMGLALCKRLVELMGGAIGVDSEPGRGSRFWFTIPCEALEPPAPAATAPGLAAMAAPASDADASVPSAGALVPDPSVSPTASVPVPMLDGDVSVLVVDDNPVNQRVLVCQLQRLGCHTEVASDGEEAVTLSGRSFFPLIFMDCNMPHMDGYEATRAIRARDGTRPRIVAVTANALADDRERCLAAGMDDYLAKPVDRAALAQAVDTVRAPRADSPARA